MGNAAMIEPHCLSGSSIAGFDFKTPSPSQKTVSSVRQNGFAISMSRPGRANQLTKNYPVGLEMSCPGGAYHWAPEIPGTGRIAGPTPGKCELAHNRSTFFAKSGWAQVRARNS